MSKTVMSSAVTTALAPVAKAAAAAISAPPMKPVTKVIASRALPIPASDEAELAQLSPAQLLYLRALLKGKNVTAAASEAGVTRQTAYRWQADPRFAAVLSIWSSRALKLTRVQLLALTEEATANVAVAIKNGDLRVSLALLKGVGGLSPKSYEQPEVAEQSAK